MTDLDVFRLCAQACGKSTTEMSDTFTGNKWLRIGPTQSFQYWNPFTNAEQRWECLRKLLDSGIDVCLSPQDDPHQVWEVPYEDDESKLTFSELCPAEEFPARALAKLAARKALTSEAAAK